MNKFVFVFVVWIIVSLCYVILAMIMPVMQSVSESTATAINTTSNMTNYPGTLETVQSFPLIAWFIPGIIGVGLTVWQLKFKD